MYKTDLLWFRLYDSLVALSVVVVAVDASDVVVVWPSSVVVLVGLSVLVVDPSVVAGIEMKCKTIS